MFEEDRDSTNAELLMMAAIDTIAKSPCHMGRNAKTNGKSYNEWESNIFKNYEQMGRLWN